MVEGNVQHTSQTITSGIEGWRKFMLQPSLYLYIVAIFFFLDAAISILLNPISWVTISSAEIGQFVFITLSAICLIFAVTLSRKTELLYFILLGIMVQPLFIVNSNLMDLRMSVHYVAIAFLILFGQQSKRLSYQAFIGLTLIMLLFFLSLVLKPKINIDETSISLKVQMVISVTFSVILIILGILVQKARSYYIIIEKELLDQIGYIIEAFTKISSYHSTLESILQEFEEKTRRFFNESNCSFTLNSDNLTADISNDLTKTNSKYFKSFSQSKSHLIKKIRTANKLIYEGNARKAEHLDEEDKKFGSILVVPIMNSAEVIGMIKITNDMPYFINESHLNLTEIIAVLSSSKILELQNLLLNEQSLELEIESQQLHEIDKLKQNFIENISRNIETPIQMILNDSSKLQSNINEHSIQKLIQLIHSNSDQLKGIIDQLIQLNEIEVRGIELYLEQIDIGCLMHNWKDSFQKIADSNQIRLTIEGLPSLVILGDEKKLSSIIQNLVNNALKYTPKNGCVEVKYYVINSTFYLAVNDSGEGIPTKYRKKIFDRFFRIGEADGRGTGIGLSIVKELVDLFGGTIDVSDSDLGGSSFQFSFSMNDMEDLYQPNKYEDTPDSNIQKDTNKPLILVVDDHDEMRQFICDSLMNEFESIQAQNGKIGFESAKKNIPDLIITDLMMPEMNGEELTALIRSDDDLNHIPIIVLSAKSAGTNKIALYDLGADNYLIKPFEVDELLAIIRSLLQVRNQLREQFKSKFHLEDAAEEIYDGNENRFIEKTKGIILENISNSDFNVSTLCTALGVGRNQLARKIKAITNMTPVELIRETRLKEAAILLTKTDLTVSDIAYQVGFSNLSYFTKSFKNTFGILPSTYQRS